MSSFMDRESEHFVREICFSRIRYQVLQDCETSRWRLLEVCE